MHNSIAVVETAVLAANKIITSEHRIRARRILGGYIYPQYEFAPGLKKLEECVLYHLEQGCAEEYGPEEMIAAAAVVLAYADLHWARFVGDRRPTGYQLKVLLRASKMVITVVAHRFIDARDRHMTVVTPRSIEYAAIESAHRLSLYRERIEDFLTNTRGSTLAHGL